MQKQEDTLTGEAKNVLCPSPSPLERFPPVRGNFAKTLQEDVGTWADHTFPQSTNKSITAHLQEEIGEFLEDESPNEAADIVMLLMHHAHKNGYDLLEAVESKLLVNKNRTWATKPNEKGYFKHEGDDE